MLPLIRFREMLMLYKQQMDEDFSELINAAEIIGARPNYLLFDESGHYHIQASGTLDEVMSALEKQLEKLNAIKQREQR